MFNIIKEFRNENKFLSNFYLCDVTYNGVKYASSEHAYQAQKAINEEDKKKFTENITVGEAKKLGNKIKIRKDWNQQTRVNIMTEIVNEKFKQNSELKKLLKETKNSLLIEGNNWHDNFWGDCYCNKCINKKGKNILGKILMIVRKTI